MNTYDIICPTEVNPVHLQELLRTISEKLVGCAYTVVHDNKDDQIQFGIGQEQGLVLNIKDQLEPECGWGEFYKIINDDDFIGPEPDLVVVAKNNVIEWGCYGRTVISIWIQRYTVEAIAKHFGGTVDYGDNPRQPNDVADTFIGWYNAEEPIYQKSLSISFWSFDVTRCPESLQEMLASIISHIPNFNKNLNS